MVRKVGKYVRLRYVECKNCNSYLEYEKRDTKTETTPTHTQEYIRCPVCLGYVIVWKREKGHSAQSFFTVKEELVLDKE